MNSSLKGIITKYLELKDRENEFVLATIIETRGSTYRKAGARLLITRSGDFFGLLGGGCFEADLMEHAIQIFTDKKTQTLFYDMRGPEDLVWGLGLGCNGAVRIRLEYTSVDDNFAPLSVLESALLLNQECVVATVSDSNLEKLNPDSHKLITIDQTIGMGGELPAEVYNAAKEILVSGESGIRQLQIDDQNVEIFFSIINPPVQLIVVGGGPDSVPVINTAHLLGWNVTLIDFRESYTKKENFPADTNVIQSTPEELEDDMEIFNADAVVLMTHKFEYDLRYLKAFVPTPVPYIGLLGPAARKKELLKSLDISTGLDGRIFGPVGMDIGGELPEEIALSLIAEIQAVLNNKKGGHLSLDENMPDINKLKEKISIVILAAGGSSRFGALKQLLEYNGKSLLKRSVETALELNCHEVIVVHGPKATKCQREIATYGVENVINEDWENGQSLSLKLGFQTVSPGIKAVMVLLCDQPLVDFQILDNLINTWARQQTKIVSSKYADTKGVPAIIPESFFKDIKKLSGDRGAKKLLAEFDNEVITVNVPEAEYDIDTQEDFSELLMKKPA